LKEGKQSAMVTELAPRVTRSVLSKGPRFLTRALWVASCEILPPTGGCVHSTLKRGKGQSLVIDKDRSGMPPLTESSRNCELARLVQQSGVAPVPHGTWNVPR
jgi:hypothetical protein